MSQKTISSFYGKRKRVESEDIKASAKKLHIDYDYISTKKLNNDQTKIISEENTNDASSGNTQEGLNKKKQADIRCLFKKIRDDNQKINSETSIAQPAYQKYSHLIENTGLPLPFKFKELLKFFEATDMICSMMTNRKEDITFMKLKSAVDNMMKKNFSTQHLAMMINIMPEAYSCELLKMKNVESTTNQCELIVRFTGDAPITPKILKERKEKFHKVLLERTKDYHEEFLKNLSPPMHVNKDDLKRWHPDFMVSDVPDIPPKKLPQLPIFKQATVTDVLARAREFLGKCSEVQKNAKESGKAADLSLKVNEEIKNTVEARLNERFTFKSFQEKLRAKKAAERLDTKPISSQDDKISRLYTTMENLKRLFTYEKKNVLPCDRAVAKLQFCSKRNLSKEDAENDIRSLIKHLPEWISAIDYNGKTFLKINKNIDVSRFFLNEKLKV